MKLVSQVLAEHHPRHPEGQHLRSRLKCPRLDLHLHLSHPVLQLSQAENQQDERGILNVVWMFSNETVKRYWLSS